MIFDRLEMVCLLRNDFPVWQCFQIDSVRFNKRIACAAQFKHTLTANPSCGRIQTKSNLTPFGTSSVHVNSRSCPWVAYKPVVDVIFGLGKCFGDAT